ncbi:MAG: dTDP-4-dehydrorhamnose 3,5-epimerase family protein [Candidatus Nanoarchaeia archaeon]
MADHNELAARDGISIRESKIQGVKIISLKANADDRGFLIETWRKSWDMLPTPPGVTQVYTVIDPVRGIIRAFHKHAHLWDLFHIISGSAKFGLIDDRPDSPTYNMQETIITGARNPSLIIVPPGVFHGWMSLEDDTIMLSIASHEYDRKNPDEVRVPPNHAGYDWQVKGR